MTDARRNRPLNDLHLALMVLAARPQGCSNRDLQDTLGINFKQAGSGLNISAVSGRTVVASHPDDPKHRRHHFTSAAAAKAWAAVPAPSAAERKPAEPKAAKAPQGHTWRPDICTAGASKMAASTASEPATAPKITRAPSPPALGVAARHYIDQATLRGEFMLIGIGRDVETGKPWGTAA